MLVPFSFSVYLATPVTDMVVGVIDHAVLTRSDTMNLLIGLDTPHSIHLMDCAIVKLRCVAYLKGNSVWGVLFLVFPRIGSDEMQVVHLYMLLIDLLGVVAMRHEEYVTFHVLLHHEPRTSAEAKSLPLAYGVEPQAAMLADETACLQFTHIALVLT